MEPDKTKLVRVVNSHYHYSPEKKFKQTDGAELFNAVRMENGRE